MASSVNAESNRAQVENAIALLIDSGLAGIRLDHLLARSLPDTSRSRISASIKTGLILVNGEQKKSSYKLKQGDQVAGELYEPPPVSVEPEDINFPILFEDSSLLVLSKPPGLVVHPGNGNVNGTLVNGLVYHCNSIGGVGDAVRPGIVHRLDKDTSGVMVVAKNDDVHRKLVDLFKSREVKKEYIAIVHGRPKDSSGRVVAPIGRHPVNRQKMAIRETSGKYAVSNWQVVEEYGTRFSKIRVRIETGRTHQIRVHMAHLKHPVAGDIVYGAGWDNSLFPRQMLHAWKLEFIHPLSCESLEFCAPVWEDMAKISKSLVVDSQI